MKYALAPKAIFWSLQGEGHLRGFQMCFLRLAGCSVGCRQCDTNYDTADKQTADDIAQRCHEETPGDNRDRWVWITGGEPADFDLRPLITALKAKQFSVAVATSGHKRVVPPVDWLSVSPHSTTEFIQVYGNEIKLIDGLNDLDIYSFLYAHPDSLTDFMYRYVQPMSVNGKEDPDSLQRCLEFLKTHHSWGLSRQDHIYWGQP